MALNLACVGIMFLLLLLKIHGRSNTLCPQTSFYHNCWIRRFPGLFLNLPGSQQRGAQVLQTREEQSAQLCSRKCCNQESCNLAVSFLENSQGQVRCHLVHCPSPGSCILHQKESAVLFTITAGIDPDLLVFEKFGPVDLNPRSSVKLDRLNASGALPPKPPHPVSHPQASIPDLPSSAPSIDPTEPSLPSPKQSIPHPPSSGESPLRSFPPTHSISLTTPYNSDIPSATYSVSSSQAETAPDEDQSSTVPSAGQPMPDLQSAAHLDSNKQHLNETKGHSGKNQSSDTDVEDTSGRWVGLWLLPGLVGSSIALLCCCSGVLMLGCCRWKRRGRYRPGRVVDSRKGALIRFALLKEKE
ncbi:hypothetical protein GDO86_004874 [Hymenochirus boettgeri]|uniref:MANSC domain-containing protein n=1 Tax=Hymenochirus boettgeri TaxID=247094 RepID=A0A8T2J511_9PIPI|nr:hypothetical protein GDO86_004874 [Hymenochirus boettgeri]